MNYVAPYEACAVIELAGAEPDNAGDTGRFIIPFEAAEHLPRSAGPRIVRPAVWRSAARAALATATPSWSALRAAARARLTLLPYQLEPAIALTSGLGCRVLLADDVGLGKTIQAGFIIAELLERERGARVLIVTPAGLREQWRDELRDRFAIDSEIAAAATLAKAAGRVPPGVNPWGLAPVAITSIDFLKRPDVVRALEPLVWDLAVFDEAHALGGRSDRAAAADLVARRARRVVAITATPHNGDERAYRRLCALGRLDDDDAALLIFRRSRAEAGVPRSRRTRLVSIPPTREEAAVHDALADYADRVDRDAPRETAAAARLAMIVLSRRACSSAASLARSIERRIAFLGDAGSDALAQLRLPLDDRFNADDEEPGEELAAPGLPDRRVERRWLDRILGLARAVRDESKIGTLVRLLRRAGEPALVFTEYRDTLQHLASSLPLDAAILHGGLTAAERAREARRFTHGEARLLLATDAASEGLNLHRRCRLVINLDVPWTPLRIEQRIGRVDRLGQQRRVHAVTLVANHASERAVAAGLITRRAQADLDAPYGRSVDLEARAKEECIRLSSVRRIAGRPCASRRTDAAVFTCVRHQRRRELLMALRFLFVDRTGAMVWHTVAGIAVPCPPLRGRDARSLRRVFERAVSDHPVHLAGISATLHDGLLAALRVDLGRAVAPLLDREVRLLRQIVGSSGRMAAPLVQPGLFDGRALHAAEAQERVAEEAAERARARLSALEHLRAPLAGDRHLVFAVAFSS